MAEVEVRLSVAFCHLELDLVKAQRVFLVPKARWGVGPLPSPGLRRSKRSERVHVPFYRAVCMGTLGPMYMLEE